MAIYLLTLTSIFIRLRAFANDRAGTTVYIVFHSQDIHTESIVLETRPIKSGLTRRNQCSGRGRNITRVENQQSLVYWAGAPIGWITIDYARATAANGTPRTRNEKYLHGESCVPCRDCENNNYTWRGNNDRPRVDRSSGARYRMNTSER